MKFLFFSFLTLLAALTACSPTAAPETQTQPSFIGIIGLVLILGSIAYSVYLKRRK